MISLSGTAFGSCTDRGAQPMPPLLSPAALAVVPRQRDRRRGLRDVLEAVARAVEQRPEAPLLRSTFETALRQAIPGCAIQLRELGPRWPPRHELASSSESIALDVPVIDGAQPAVLEARFDPACRLGDWDYQLLGAASHVAALVLELERAWGQLMRAGHAALAQQKRDGAAPLIGSTPAMQTLRATIEQVAHTDFTVLIEGPRGRM